MVKISDVAALAGVSPGAVSRVLSGDATLRVSAETRERVLAAALQLDYVPNHAARSLRTSHTSTVALVVPDVTSAVFAELAGGAEDEAARRGFTIVLGRAETLDADRDWVKRVVAEGRIDGMVLQLPDGSDLSSLHSVLETATPIVVINSVDNGPYSTVVLDDGAGVRVAVEHLVSLGHSSIGLIGGLPGSSTGRRRLTGFLRAMDAMGLESRDEWITNLGYGGPDGRLAADQLLSAPRQPTALVVANLNAALGVLAQIHARGLRVPDDISIVAIHDVWYADATWPPITTVRMPLRELGAAAIAALVERGMPRHVVIDGPGPMLILRQSTSEPAQPSSRPGRNGSHGAE
jgi:LacI family transcriptional regulator